MQVGYCEEEFECRRIMLLVHFGETFSAAQCKGTCDTCLHAQAQAHELRDMSAAAQDAIKAGPPVLAAMSVGLPLCFGASQACTVHGCDNA